jgi:hypothetical protein
VAISWFRRDLGLAVWLLSFDRRRESMVFAGTLLPIRWSADGAHIFGADVDVDQRVTAIVEFSADGSGPTDRTLDFAPPANSVDLLPDGRVVAVIATRNSDVWLDGLTERREVAPASSIGTPSPSGKQEPVRSGEPKNLDFETGTPGEPPVGWVLDAEVSSQSAARLSDQAPPQGRHAAVVEVVDEAVIEQVFDALPYRGKRVRVGCAMRASGRATASLRVRSNRAMGVFRWWVMSKPSSPLQWTRKELVADIARDASSIVLSVVASGNGEIWIDDVRIEVLSAKHEM